MKRLVLATIAFLVVANGLAFGQISTLNNTDIALALTEANCSNVVYSDGSMYFIDGFGQKGIINCNEMKISYSFQFDPSETITDSNIAFLNEYNCGLQWVANYDQNTIIAIRELPHNITVEDLSLEIISTELTVYILNNIDKPEVQAAVREMCVC